MITVITSADLERLRKAPKNTKVRAFKYVTTSGSPPTYAGASLQTKDGVQTHYVVGKTYSVKADTNESKDCGPGLHAGTAEYILSRASSNHKILILEFRKRDVAAIPTVGYLNKFRMHKVKVVGEFAPSFASRMRDRLRHFRKHAR